MHEQLNRSALQVRFWDSAVVSKLKRGITIAELIGIFAMLSVLCAAVTPHLLEVREANKLSMLRFKLQKLRQRIDDYRHRHGHPPKELGDAFAESENAVPPDLNGDHQSKGNPNEIPENPLSNAMSGSRNRVKNINVDPPGVEQVTGAGLGGWLYNPITGGVWADSESFLDE